MAEKITWEKRTFRRDAGAAAADLHFFSSFNQAKQRRCSFCFNPVCYPNYKHFKNRMKYTLIPEAYGPEAMVLF